jgi:hypothetical protein
MTMKTQTSMLAMAIALATCPALAAKPVDGAGLPFGNGFPSGEHYNLNIIGKKAGFVCPVGEVDAIGNPVYGNVLFFPRVQGTDAITILVESGSKGPRGATGTATLEVTDWCTESFPDAGAVTGDGATFRLPANAGGYAVYARITGKPGKDGQPTVTFNQGGLTYVEDEIGSDLILVGSFKDGATTIYRTGEVTTASGKGVRKATDITGMFEWSGLACSVPSDQTLADTSLCCQTDPSTGAYVNCQLPDDLGACPVEGSYSLVQADCTEYAEPTWVFNIADFVGYLWDLDTTGAYVVQLRFYPIK